MLFVQDNDNGVKGRYTVSMSFSRIVSQPERKPSAQFWYRVALLFLILVALALRVWFVSVNELDPAHSPADDGDYYQRALRFATTGQYIDDFWLIRPPLHVFLFALMLRIGILLGNVPGLLLVQSAQVLLSLLSIPIGYSLARRLFGVRAGLIFAALLAVWYPLIELPAHLFTEPLFIFLLLAHLWLLVWWRDERRWHLLAASGVVLGLTALTRSVALYGAVFVVGWLVLESVQAQVDAQRNNRGADGQEAPGPSALWSSIRTLPLWQTLRQTLFLCLLFCVPFALTVLPWTVRNYVVYQRVILVDTIGSVNLWLHMEKYEEKGVEILKKMPQRDRQDFAIADTRRMFFEDPVHFWSMLWRNAWLHFLHIWKGQFLEDFLLKVSFYGRPLRAMWIPGVIGDLLWFVFTPLGLMALVAPLREGHIRWVLWGWAAYTMLMVMIFHVEPRYLMPLWLVLALSASWVLGYPVQFFALLRQRRLFGGIAAVVAISFLVLCFSYRDYPTIVRMGFEREWHRAAGVQAFAAGDDESAVRELQTVVDVQPTFASSRAELAFALLAQGCTDEAQAIVGEDDAQHILIARGALALAQGDSNRALALFIRAEEKSGDNAQRVAMEWLRPSPTTRLGLGSAQAYGAIVGFSLPEQTGDQQPYRWLQGHGRMVLSLPAPLREADVVALRLSGGPGDVPLLLHFVDAQGKTVSTVPIRVEGGAWRTYYLPVPAALVGQQRLDIRLDAPIFLPAHLYPGSNDIRPLSLMVQAVWVKE